LLARPATPTFAFFNVLIVIQLPKSCHRSLLTSMTRGYFIPLLDSTLLLEVTYETPGISTFAAILLDITRSPQGLIFGRRPANLPILSDSTFTSVASPVDEETGETPKNTLIITHKTRSGITAFDSK
jgi:hypothetical protein